MLQQKAPEDIVIATGKPTEVREFVRLAFLNLGIQVEFKGQGLQEKAFVVDCQGEFKIPIGREVVAVDPRYYRPTEVDLLLGNPSKARSVLGWEPKYDLNELVKEMIAVDLDEAKRQNYLLKAEVY